MQILICLLQPAPRHAPAMSLKLSLSSSRTPITTRGRPHRTSTGSAARCRPSGVSASRPCMTAPTLTSAPSAAATACAPGRRLHEQCSVPQPAAGLHPTSLRPRRHARHMSIATRVAQAGRACAPRAPSALAGRASARAPQQAGLPSAAHTQARQATQSARSQDRSGWGGSGRPMQGKVEYNVRRPGRRASPDGGSIMAARKAATGARGRSSLTCSARPSSGTRRTSGTCRDVW